MRQSWDDAQVASSASVVASRRPHADRAAQRLFGNSFGQIYSADGSFGYFTPRVAATYKLTPDMNLYGTVSKGYAAAIRRSPSPTPPPRPSPSTGPR